MSVLILKLGATGDVVRTTTLLRCFKDHHITWITAAKNLSLLQGLESNLRPLPWEQCDHARDSAYDLVINLEDSMEVSQFARSVRTTQIFGAYADNENQIRYTQDSRRWFDLSIISAHGIAAADRLKLLNRHTYQELIFDGLGFRFDGERYLLPKAMDTGLSGDVAIATEAGPVWPMKKWAHYDQLKGELEARGLVVNVLPQRPSLLEHLADVPNHRVLVGGDTLPMHFALGTGTQCVSLFNCTSPWEIHDYGLQTKIVSPLLEQFFYQREFDPRATTAIPLGDVLAAVLKQLATVP